MSLNFQQHLFHSLNNRINSVRRLVKWTKGHLRQESLAHEVHAPDVHVHCEVPVGLFAVQYGAGVHKSADIR